MFIKIQWLMVCFATLLLGVFLAFYVHPVSISAPMEKASQSYGKVHQKLDQAEAHFAETEEVYQAMQSENASSQSKLTAIHDQLNHMIASANAEIAHYTQQGDLIGRLAQDSSQQSLAGHDLLGQILSNILGDPIGQTFNERSAIKVFSLQEAGYRGYMAKVKIHDPKAIKLVLSHDKVGDPGETTSEAARRKKAVLAINGGGFARQNGQLYPMGVTVVDGEVKTFYQVGLSFIGFNNQGNLVGGEIHSREQLEQLGVLQGATFVPTLLKDGKKTVIPAKWANRKEPRTMIGHFSNGDLLFIVIDGRQKGSSGVTLEEAQDKLLEFNVRDAYNLDGGGSSTFYYNGKVLNNPSDGKERKLASSFVILP